MLGFIVPMFEEQPKYPLRPFIIWGIAGFYLAIPIEGEADFIELFAEAFDIGFGGNRWVLSGLDGILFCGKSESIVSHWVQHVEAGKAFVAGYNIGSDVP